MFGFIRKACVKFSDIFFSESTYSSCASTMNNKAPESNTNIRNKKIKKIKMHLYELLAHIFYKIL